MSISRWNKVVVVAATALLISTLAAASRADSMLERQRVARNYECCYGPSCYGSKGYIRDFNGCRHSCDCEDDDDCCLAQHCCLYRCLSAIMSPGGGCHSKCVDICLYRLAFPVSPWYSNPRDGMLYPAYGSKSPTCLYPGN
jgi:hypothetical protein